MRRIVLAAFEGALAGCVAGAILGIWHAQLNGDARHGMWFLLTWRVELFAFTALLAGAAISTALALLAGALAGRARWVVVLAPLSILAVSLAFVPVRSWASMLLRPPGGPSNAAWVSLLPLALAAVTILVVRTRDAGKKHQTSPARPSRGALIGLAVSVLAVIVHFSLPRVGAQRAAGHPSVVLISLDTVRADRLGVAGYERGLTPALDRLAEEGAAFLQATSTAPWTFPAHLSLFTSTLPFDSRVRLWRAAPDSVLLAEIFRNAGYRTMAHTGGTWVDDRIGFAQGFESFESHDEIEENGAAGYFEEAADWIERLDGAPFFLFLHTYEPHIPYTHHEFVHGGASGGVGEEFDIDNLESLRDGSFVPDEAERQYIVDLYDGDVAAADAYVGAFLERLDRVRPAGDVVVAVVSDHGEDLWDHYPERSADHGHSLYEELLKVPWIIRQPGTIPPGVRIEAPVSLLAVAPTLLELAGLPRHGTQRGRSLATNLREVTEPSPRTVFAEMVEYGPDRFSVRLGDLKIILTPMPGEVHNEVYLPADTLEVFDLVHDPGEHTNLGLAHLGPSSFLERALGLRAAECVNGAASGADVEAIPEELLEQMRALGYTQ